MTEISSESNDTLVVNLSYGIYHLLYFSLSFLFVSVWSLYYEVYQRSPQSNNTLKGERLGSE